MRLVYLSQYAHSPFCWVPELDSLYNLQEASAILSGHVSHAPYWRAPFYSHFLAMIQLVCGKSLLAPRVVQMAIGSLNCVLLYLIGQRIFNQRVAIIAAAGMALYGPLVFNDGELQTPAVEIAFDLTLLLLSLIASERRSAGLWAVAGLVLGLSAITRPTILWCAPIFAWLAWTRWPTDSAPRSRALAVTALAVTAALFPAIVTARNAIVGHDRVIIASQGGINLWIGNRVGADGFTPKTPRHYDFDGAYQDAIELYGQRAAEDAVGHPLKPSEAQAYWVRQTLIVWRDHPAASLKLLWKKLVLTWTRTEIRDNVAFDYMRKEWTPSLWVCFLGFGIVAPMALVGMVLAWRATPQVRWIIVLALYYMTTFCVFFAAERFRLPVVPLLLLFAALLADFVWQCITNTVPKTGRINAPLLLALLLPAAILVNGNWYRVVTPDVVALDYWSAGNRYSELRRYDAAIPQYLTALKLDGSNAEIWMNLGVANYYEGNFSNAIPALQRSIKLAPSASALFDLATCYEQIGNKQSAFVCLTEALRLDPGYKKAADALVSLQSSGALTHH